MGGVTVGVVWRSNVTIGYELNWKMEWYLVSLW